MHRFQCSKCLHTFGFYEGYNDDPQERDCPECKNAKGEIFYLGNTAGASMPSIQKDYEAIKSPVTGKMIEGKRELREHLKQTGCRIVDPSEAKSHGIKQ